MNPKRCPTQAQIRAVLGYDPATGVFRWKYDSQGHRAGAIAGKVIGHGYRQICVDGVIHYAHRLAWVFVHGYDPTGQLDHINASRDDNRIANLREATDSQNKQNGPGRSRIGHPKGVKVSSVNRATGSKRYAAQIGVQGKVLHLGCFGTPEEAHAEYRRAASERFGEFARFA